MNDFLKMDVFFVVSTIAVVVVALLLSYAIYKAIRILRKVEEISDSVSQETALIRGDIEEARLAARREGYRLAGVVKGARLFAERMIKRKR